VSENDSYSAWSSEKFYQSYATGIQSILPPPAPQSQAIYTLHGRYVGTDASVLPHGVYIVGGKKIVK
jgi:immune inhibitor A